MIVAQWSTIQPFAVEEGRIVDEIELHSGAHTAVEHRAEAIAIVERHRNAGNDRARMVELGLPVTRKKDGNLEAQISERRRQGADDIGEATRLGERNTLGRRKGNMHESSGAG